MFGRRKKQAGGREETTQRNALDLFARLCDLRGPNHHSYAGHDVAKAGDHPNLRVRELARLNDLWKPYPNTIGASGESELDEGKQNYSRVFESGKQKADFILSALFEYSLTDNGFLFRSQPFGIFGMVGEQPKRSDAENYNRKSFDNK